MEELLSLETIKEYIGVTSDTDDDLLEMLRDLAIGEVEAYCDREFDQQTISGEVLSTDNSNFDRLPIKPFDLSGVQLTAQTAQSPVVASGETITYQGRELVLDSDYKMDYENGIIYFYTGVSSYERTLLINYTYGYTDDTIPGALKSVFLELIANKYREHGATKGEGQVQSKQLGNFSVTYRDIRSNTDYYKGILNKFRMIFV